MCVTVKNRRRPSKYRVPFMAVTSATFVDLLVFSRFSVTKFTISVLRVSFSNLLESALHWLINSSRFATPSLKMFSKYVSVYLIALLPALILNKCSFLARFQLLYV